MFARKLALIGAGVMLALPASPAHASVGLQECVGVTRRSTGEQATVCQGFDFHSTNGNAVIQGFGAMGTGSSGVRLQIDHVNLARNTGGAIAMSGTVNANGGPYVEARTPEVFDDCTNFKVRVYFSIRWADGALSSHQAVSWVTNSGACSTSAVGGVAAHVPDGSDPVADVVIE